MKACSSQEIDSIKNSHLDISVCCKETLDNLKGKPWKALFKKIAHNWRTRSELSRLNEDQLKDIGLTAEDVDHEIHKPLWR
ncbi:DUF1127 domain-containing protein [Nitrincola sp. MINF-07-Sa-05]|uniref:DUF1127 domain-containing protein n=1 Tax=Nitrincola salilacus TaxID=3400273 RepID=UPI003918114C